MDSSKNIRKYIINSVLVAFIFIVLIFLMSCLFITNKNEYGVVREFGKIVKITNFDINTLTEEEQNIIKSQKIIIENKIGISFKKPIIQSVSLIPKTKLLYDLPISDVITQDKKTMVTDSFVIWRINNPFKFIKSLNSNITNAEDRLSVTVYNSMKNVMSSMSQADIIANRNGSLPTKIQNNIGEDFSQYGIEIIAVETKHLDLPKDNKDAVYQRMISERNNIAAQYEADGDSKKKIIENETNKDVSIKISKANSDAQKLIAEGEAEYMKILSNAYSDQSRADFYEFVRSLDAISDSMKGDNKTLILSKDSPIAKVFYLTK